MPQEWVILVYKFSSNSAHFQKGMAFLIPRWIATSTNILSISPICSSLPPKTHTRIHTTLIQGLKYSLGKSASSICPKTSSASAKLPHSVSSRSVHSFIWHHVCSLRLAYHRITVCNHSAVAVCLCPDWSGGASVTVSLTPVLTHSA